MSSGSSTRKGRRKKKIYNPPPPPPQKKKRHDGDYRGKGKHETMQCRCEGHKPQTDTH